MHISQSDKASNFALRTLDGKGTAKRLKPIVIKLSDGGLEPLEAGVEVFEGYCAWPYGRDVCCGRQKAFRKPYCEGHLKAARPKEQPARIR